MWLSSRLRSIPKLVENRGKILYKTKAEAAKDFWKVSGATVLLQLGLAITLLEFGFPTPDVVFDLKRTISPDFDLFTRHGQLGEFQMELSNQLRGLKAQQSILEEQKLKQKSPDAIFGGIA